MKKILKYMISALERTKYEVWERKVRYYVYFKAISCL